MASHLHCLLGKKVDLSTIAHKQHSKQWANKQKHNSTSNAHVYDDLHVFGVQLVRCTRVFGPLISSLWSPLSWNTLELIHRRQHSLLRKALLSKLQYLKTETHRLEVLQPPYGNFTNWTETKWGFHINIETNEVFILILTCNQMLWDSLLNCHARTYLTEMMSMTSSGVLSVTLRSRPSCSTTLPSRLVELLSSESQSTAAWPRAPSTPILADRPTWTLEGETASHSAEHSLSAKRLLGLIRLCMPPEMLTFSAS